MSDQDKPFTLETYKEVKAGTKVEVHLSNKQVLHGTSGFLWGEGEPMPVIKFRDGSVIRVTEHMVGLVRLELLN